jgi:hypothetical protein
MATAIEDVDLLDNIDGENAAPLEQQSIPKKGLLALPGGMSFLLS